jgi:hypothetical protein
MKNLRKLGAAVALTCALGLSVFAGQTDTPPCAPPEPGQIDTPPCTAAPSDMGTPTEATAPGDIDTPTLASSETSFTKIATDVLLNFLPLF